MSAEAAIIVGELVLSGRDASDGEVIAAAFHHELARLWRADHDAGGAWTGELGAVSFEFDEGLGGEPLGRALAKAVRGRALRAGDVA